MSEPTKVYVWNMRLREGCIGHASMQIGGADVEGSYVSLFPGGEGVGLLDYFRRTDVDSAPQARLLDDILNEENHHPDYTGLLYGLDTQRMEQMWDLLKRDPGSWKDQIAGFIKKWNSVYNLKKFNCSSTVAFILLEGGAASHAKAPRIWFHWAPKDIAKWCRRLEKKIGTPKQTGSAYAKKFGQKMY
ncbi:hypothetical protein DESC_760049 [Desulfosarcina cetonica]|uniref:hypothetical protein n=1 Tax=Desulfosarcina cetonica TaxID=90730 RepID=UPI0006D29BE9|nr:hypothetical protein [Desulfosarcina cetonica]VTR69623.1 hypothetical protein DESC_760049 [Desulfosarcina cetonica]